MEDVVLRSDRLNEMKSGWEYDAAYDGHGIEGLCIKQYPPLLGSGTGTTSHPKDKSNDNNKTNQSPFVDNGIDLHVVFAFGLFVPGKTTIPGSNHK
jgi:hypothetical protein